ncbi:hypothetical protein [Burkholderia stagnalis]|uniref:hypothetical protein n=1 Tax=Burkholderia stagnalis TaxID=1503054 RepID=UPI000B16FA32|nr:hypothetical protein [Burkholderia stagnalis]
MNICKYSLIMFYPTPERLDQVVAGAVFHNSAMWDVRVGADIHKMAAIDPSFKLQRLELLREFVARGCSTSQDLPGLRDYLQSMRAAVYLHTSEDAFFFSDKTHYERQVQAVIAESVDVAKPRALRRPRNRVRRDLRSRFQQLKLWSKQNADIDRHRVVEQFLLSEEHGIVAEFALKNGAMHITETIDFDMQTATAKRVEAQAKTLVLDEAQRVFGDTTKKYVVVAGANISGMEASVRLLQDRATVYSLESDDDMHEYMTLMASAASYQPLIAP